MSKIDANTIKPVVKYSSNAAITAAITANTAKHMEVDNEWQAIAMSVLVHIDTHRDVSVVNNLVNALYKGLGKGARHTAMTQWLLDYAPVIANVGPDKADKPFVFSKAKAKEAIRYADAANNPWYGKKPSKTPDQVFDLRAVLKSAVKKVQAAAKEDKFIVGCSYDDVVALAKLAGVELTDLPSAESLKLAKSKDDAKAAAKLEETATAE